ncbi:MAG TPA: hypothetical protein VEL11_17625 [Candidatus Bathyarchaeia archaeon]|nr:hypothetical protein [Candidatus Bathyarchaeia archaeon]
MYPGIHFTVSKYRRILQPIRWRSLRHYVLTSIRGVPMSGKEIIDKAIDESGGIWKPSPGLMLD